MRRYHGDVRIVGTRWAVTALAAAVLAVASGCHQGMWDRSHYKPLEKAEFSPFFDNGRTALPLPENTVPYQSPDLDDFFYTGKIDGEYATVFPFEVTREVLERGRDRFNIHCAPCHSALGNGEGMIVQREMKKAGDYHIKRLRDAGPGYFFDVMTNGFGVMYSAAFRVPPEDRWAIAAYIRVLQFSQHANIDDLPADVREKVMNPQPESTETSDEANHAAH